MAKIGVIGLGVMGANIARNIANHGFQVVGFNRSPEVTQQLIEEHGSENLIGHENLDDFVNTLEKPRKVILLVKAGKPVDAVIDQLIPLLDEGDIIIDGGNSLFTETQSRTQKLAEHKIHFIGSGVSGGEEGALNGPSLMPGGDKEAYKEIQPIFQAIAAKDFEGQPCVTHIGPDGSGHYVKMVHNGIEYAIMQIIAESYQILKDLYSLQPNALEKIFKKYNDGKLNSFLFEITVQVLAKKDNLAPGFLIDKILDKAGQKGTGRWTVIDAYERGIPIPSIAEAVNARSISSFKDERVKLSKIYQHQAQKPELELDQFTQILEDAMYAAILACYAQGYHLIKTASDEQNWEVQLAEVTRIWQGGCIIRAEILKFIEQNYQKEPNTPMLKMSEVSKALNELMPSLQTVLSITSKSAVPTPVLSASLNYLLSMTSGKTSANIIQALRDNFGSHTFERTDREGNFHAEW